MSTATAATPLRPRTVRRLATITYAMGCACAVLSSLDIAHVLLRDGVSWYLAWSVGPLLTVLAALPTEAPGRYRLLLPIAAGIMLVLAVEHQSTAGGYFVHGLPALLMWLFWQVGMDLVRKSGTGETADTEVTA